MQINVLEYFERTAKLYPLKTAVIEGDRKMSFEELSVLSKALAIKLIDLLRHEVNKPVGIYLPKSCDCIIADIATTYSGNIYMNLDVKSPVLRIANIIQQIKPVLIISNNSNIERLKDVAGDCILVNIEESGRVLSIEENLSIKLYQIDTDPYCIINTSGSTGTPKGVVLNHKSFIDFTEWAIDTLKIGENEIIGSLSPSVFDIYSFELCMMMGRGSLIVILPDTLAAFPANLLKMMWEKKVSFIFWVPTIMVNIANMELLSRIPLPELRTVWFAGEVFPTKQFNYWKSYLPETKFVNLYGPIEITLDCTYFIVDRELRDDEPIPIGYPCRNTDIMIINDQNLPAKTNEEGELCVRGSSLAMGYYNNPEKTNSVFVQNPLNNAYPEIIYRTGDQVFMNEKGEIIFKGRKDTLIKHLGYRIELGEIEHVIINVLKLVENGCVIYDFKNKEIKLYYQAKSDIPITELRKAISLALPKYMIPNSYVRMNDLPINQNGKIDRLLLNNKCNN